MTRNYRRLFALIPLLVLALLLALPSLALADDGNGGRFSMFDSVRVAPGETVNGDVGSIFSSVSVQGTVNGNVYSVFSSVSVSGNGKVNGDVSSVFSSIGVSDNAIVSGSATSVFSSIGKGPSAQILGTQTTVATNREWEWPADVQVNVSSDDHEREWASGPGYWVGRIMGGVFSALLLAGLGVLAVVIFPRRVQVVRDTMVQSPWASLGVGFLGLLLSLPLALLLLITCIGFFVVIFGTFAATLFGLVAIGLWIGDRVTDVAVPRDRSMVMDTMVGLLILALVMAAFDVVPYVGWLTGFVWFALFSLAFGAVLLSRFGGMPPAQQRAQTYPVATIPPAAPYAAPYVAPYAAPEPPAAAPADPFAMPPVAPEPPAAAPADPFAMPPAPPEPPAAAPADPFAMPPVPPAPPADKPEA